MKTDKATIAIEKPIRPRSRSRPFGDKVQVNASSWEDSKVILADEALRVVALGKRFTSFGRIARRSITISTRAAWWKLVTDQKPNSICL